MPRKLPPLNPLRVSEAVARLSSITKASKELFVTQAAVSRQVYVLEDYLQEQLFVHQRGKIALTKDGRDYFDKISPALEQIAAATEDLLRDRKRNIVHINTYQTFAQYWLIPRLEEFRNAYPGIELHITTQVEKVGNEETNTGVFIQFGDGKWPGYTAVALMPDRIAPICSPGFRDRHNLGANPDELADLPLLLSNYRRRDWADWLESIGKDEAVSDDVTYFRSTGLAYQAAECGLGVAMGQLHLVADELEAGKLVTLYDAPLDRPYGYYMIHPKGMQPPLATRRFIDWAISQAVT